MPKFKHQFVANMYASGDCIQTKPLISHPAFQPLESVTRPTVPTDAAAYYLDRKPQTLRGWACHDDGPLRPIRVYGRLAWPVSELRRVLGMA